MHPSIQIFVCISLALAALLFTACDDNGIGTLTDDPSLQVRSVNPSKGKFGTEVTVTVKGDSFGETLPADNLILTFNGMPAEVVSSSAKTLKTLVPKGAGTGPVELSFKGETASGPLFTYIPTVYVSTYAGTGVLGYRDGEAFQARFNYPVGLELTDNGDLVVVDYWNHSIRIVTTDKQVSTLAGNGEGGYMDGVGSNARFYRPIDVEIADDGTVFVSDFGNHLIRHITPSGSVSTYAGSLKGYNDGPHELARFSFPAGIGLAEDHTLYVSDSENNRIRSIAQDGDTGTFAGSGLRGFENGYGLQASFHFPFGIDFGSEGRIFIADYDNHSIRIISSEVFVSTFSGTGEPGYADGADRKAQFHTPYDVAVDENDMIFVADYGNQRIRRISPKGHVITIAGDSTKGFINGDESEARFNGPIGLAVNDAGTVLYVADHHNHAIRKITIE